MGAYPHLARRPTSWRGSSEFSPDYRFRDLQPAIQVEKWKLAIDNNQLLRANSMQAT
jgi:hypothetical protein